MSQTLNSSTTWSAAHSPVLKDPTYQAYRLLHLAFIVAPILAGLDKFFHLLVNWDNYLAPVVNNILGGHGHGFMLAAGVIEIIAGIGVALRPKSLLVCRGRLAAGNHCQLAVDSGFQPDAPLRRGTSRPWSVLGGFCALGRLSSVVSH